MIKCRLRGCNTWGGWAPYLQNSGCAALVASPVIAHRKTCSSRWFPQRHWNDVQVRSCCSRATSLCCINVRGAFLHTNSTGSFRCCLPRKKYRSQKSWSECAVMPHCFRFSCGSAHCSPGPSQGTQAQTALRCIFATPAKALPSAWNPCRRRCTPQSCRFPEWARNASPQRWTAPRLTCGISFVYCAQRAGRVQVLFPFYVNSKYSLSKIL